MIIWKYCMNYYNVKIYKPRVNQTECVFCNGFQSNLDSIGSFYGSNNGDANCQMWVCVHACVVYSVPLTERKKSQVKNND